MMVCKLVRALFDSSRNSTSGHKWGKSVTHVIILGIYSNPSQVSPGPIEPEELGNSVFLALPYVVPLENARLRSKYLAN